MQNTIHLWFFSFVALIVTNILSKPQLPANFHSPLESLSLLTLNTSHRQILDKNGIAHEFNLLADFVKKVPIRRVRRPNNLNRIPEVVQAILKDISFLREKNNR